MEFFYETAATIGCTLGVVWRGEYIFNLYSYGGILNSIGFTLIGLRVFLSNTKASINRAFAIFNIACVSWSLPYVFWSSSMDKEIAIFWLRILNVGAVFTAPSLLLFIVVFLGLYSRYKKIVRAIYLSLIPFAFLFIFTNFLIADAVKDNFPFFRPVAGPLLFLYLIIWGGALVYAAYLLFRYYPSQKERPINKWLLFFGTAVGFGGGSTNFIMWYFPEIPPFGNVFVFLYAFIFMYLITQTKLFSAKKISGEIFAFAVWFLSIINILAEHSPSGKEKAVFIFIVTTLFIAFFLKTLFSEALQKEKLKDLNDHLEQKVAEQTVEVRKAYEVEKKARVELEELDKAKDQFILTTQHHLRTPLTIVKGYIGQLLEKQSVGSIVTEETHSYLAKTDSAANRIVALINELLDISQMEVGKSILNKDPTNIKNLINDVAKELEGEIRGKNLSVIIDIGHDISLNVDKSKFKEALTNLIDNAVKYNKEGGEIRVKGEKTRHPIERDKQIYKLTIEDTGIGLTQEELSRIFTQYFERGKEAEKLYTTGRGIGLTITKNIISAHNGRIYAESEGRGKGAKFFIEIPA